MTTSTLSKLAGLKNPAQELSQLEGATRPAFLLAEDARLLWANDAAVNFAGYASAEELLGTRFAGTPFAAQIGAAGRGLKAGMQRLELLRLPGKTGPLSFIGKITAIMADDGPALLIVGPEKNPIVKAEQKIRPRPKTDVLLPPQEKSKQQGVKPAKKKGKRQKQKAGPSLTPHERESLHEIARALIDSEKGIPIEIPNAADLSEPPSNASQILLADLQREMEGLAAQNLGLQNELHEARMLAAQLQAILDTATDGVFILDGDGSIRNMNRPAEALFGQDLTALKGENLLDLLDESSRETARHYMHKIVNDAQARALNDGVEVLGIEKNGGGIPLFMTLGWLGDADGRSSFCAVLRDITQWKQVEADLIASRKRAEAVSDHKSDFLAKISHEIRTPLNAIIGFSEVMLEERFGPVGSERYQQYLKDIHASGGFLLSLVNDLLDLSKVEAGKLDLRFQPVSLNELALSSVAFLQQHANRSGLILRTSLQDIPRVVADMRSLRQILLNLLSNAVRFTPEGGQIIVSTFHNDDDGSIALRVRDTGVGMTEFEIGLALEPFRQIRAEPEIEKKQGTGLGLPIARALAEANHARFDIVSEPKKGTLVSVTFPSSRLLPND